MWEAIRRLSPPHREVLVLRHWADYTYREIGDMLGCLTRTAQSRVRLAHQRLKTILTQQDVTILEEKTE